MKSSPFILSALLHMVIGSAIWCYTGVKPAPKPPVLYVDLATLPVAATEEPASLPQQPEPPQQVAEMEQPQPAPPPAEQQEVPAAQVEAPQAPGKPEQAQPAPEISRAFASASRMQEMMYNTRRYYQVAGMAVREVLEGKLRSGGRERLNGKTVQIVASYDNDAAPEFAVSCESEELRALLQDEGAWARIPSPRQCKLQYKKVAFLVSLEKGAIQVGLAPQ